MNLDTDNQTKIVEKFFNDDPQIHDPRIRLNFQFIEEMINNDIPDNIEKNECQIFNLNSLKHCILRYDPKVIYLKEAEIRTYPTDIFTKYLIQRIVDDLKVNVVFKTTLSKKILTVDKDGSINEVSNDQAKQFFLSRLDDSVLIMAVYSNIEKDIAGLVTYNIIFPKDYDGMVENIKKMLEWFTYYAYTKGYDYNSFDVYRNEKAVRLTFEAKFQDSNIEIGTLYHVAPKNLTDKIIKNGLTSTKKKTLKRNGDEKYDLNHSERVYLFNIQNGQNYKNIIRQFISQLDKVSKSWNPQLKQLQASHEFSVFKIKLDELNGLKLYRDNMTISKDFKRPIAVYTYSVIPPNAVEFVGTI